MRHVSYLFTFTIEWFHSTSYFFLVFSSLSSSIWIRFSAYCLLSRQKYVNMIVVLHSLSFLPHACESLFASVRLACPFHYLCFGKIPRTWFWIIFFNSKMSKLVGWPLKSRSIDSVFLWLHLSFAIISCDAKNVYFSHFQMTDNIWLVWCLLFVVHMAKFRKTFFFSVAVR